MTIQYQFVCAPGFSSGTINMFGGGTELLGFSHVDCLLPDGRLLGSRSDKIGDVPPGVQIRPTEYFSKWIRQVVFTLPCTAVQEKAFYDFLYSQIGKPYDKLSIFSFLVSRDWQDTSAWFCDELVAAATISCGACPQLYLPANKLSPTTWAVVLSALGATNKVLKPPPPPAYVPA